jgi:amino acid permease
MLQGSAETGERSYASLVGRVLGPAGEGLLQAALFGFCFGVMAVYLVVCGDVLAGEHGGGVYGGGLGEARHGQGWRVAA